MGTCKASDQKRSKVAIQWLRITFDSASNCLLVNLESCFLARAKCMEKRLLDLKEEGPLLVFPFKPAPNPSGNVQNLLGGLPVISRLHSTIFLIFGNSDKLLLVNRRPAQHQFVYLPRAFQQ